jgi:hypothetical protein
MAIGFPVKANYVTGEVLTATNMNDLSGTLNTIQSVKYAAGKSKIINGDFNINQRAFSSTTSSATYTFDRWRTDLSGGTVTYSAQTFTPGTAPVVGYESKNFLRIVTSGQSTSGDYALIEQRIEDVRTFANQTVTLSFWAKASTGTPKVGTTIVQNFGFGGSDIVIAKSGDVTISTSWARYSVTVAIPSISGKTVGTGSYLRNLLFTSAGTTLSSYTDIGVQNVTIDIWGVQVEASSTASDFQTATGTLQGELAACQRYYYRQTVGTTYGYLAFGMATSTTNGKIQIPLPVPLRIIPTSIDSPTAATLRFTDGVTGTACNASPTLDADTSSNSITFNVGVASGLTQYRPIFFGANNSAVAYIGFSAEL